MNIKEYIESGILELYVAGALSDKENEEIYALLLKHPELLDEVLKIESTIVTLTAAVSPTNTKHLFRAVKEKLGIQIDKETPVRPLHKPRPNWFSYVGWAALFVIGLGLLWLINQNNILKEQIQTVETDKELLEVSLEKYSNDLIESKQLISFLRDKDIIAVPLAGQTVSPDSYAKVYWDKKTNTVVLDVQGLPEPPKGKVYQVWSLTLNPLTPTSLGTIDTFSTDDNKLFTIENANASEAFGITLEPAGGSDSPTLEQLYTLGAVETS
ncbi:anti-sigma factor [Xanthomarina sp. F2636L]|uniref:anti-sigma factor n=1 Tax=Xanthomarina sp. F2636L TaxID=2996018 RepID=UPI00225DD1C7|nr:anti-sigma factor [Xanthomarina sp. F2636L]MCX7550125.1 anti-sigma factor [Xanthomarina sp. F2636L]